MYKTEILAPSIRMGDQKPLHIASVGRFQSGGDFRWEQVAKYSVLHCVRDGHGTFIDNGTPHSADAGDVFLFQPGHHYQYHDVPAQPWRYDFLTFDGDSSAALAAVLDLPAPLIKLGKDHPFWARLDDLIVTYHDPLIALTTSCQLTWGLLGALSQLDAQSGSAGLGVRVRDYLERLETDFPTVDQLAFRFGVSRATLFRAFRSTNGISVKQWIDAKRFARAKELLKVSDTPIHEIGRLCGFQDALYFSRAFKQRFGVSPKEWRLNR